MLAIEIEINEIYEWLLGVCFFETEGTNTKTGETEEFNCLQIGLLVFTISIYFK